MTSLPINTEFFGQHPPVCPWCRVDLYDLKVPFDAIEVVFGGRGSGRVTVQCDCCECGRPITIRTNVTADSVTGYVEPERTEKDREYLKLKEGGS